MSFDSLQLSIFSNSCTIQTLSSLNTLTTPPNANAGYLERRLAQTPKHHAMHSLIPSSITRHSHIGVNRSAESRKSHTPNGRSLWSSLCPQNPPCYTASCYSIGEVIFRSILHSALVSLFVSTQRAGRNIHPQCSILSPQISRQPSRNSSPN